MTFNFDEAKSRRNKAKHGIDFVEAQTLWRDAGRLEIPARSATEPRFRVVGTVGDKRWTAVITYRGKRVRIISVRRARREEIQDYEEHQR